MMASVWVEYLSMKGRGGICVFVRLTPLFLYVNMYMSGFYCYDNYQKQLRKDLFYFIVHSLSSREIKSGAQGSNLAAGTGTKAME